MVMIAIIDYGFDCKLYVNKLEFELKINICLRQRRNMGITPSHIERRLASLWPFSVELAGSLWVIHPTVHKLAPGKNN